MAASGGHWVKGAGGARFAPAVETRSANAILEEIKAIPLIPMTELKAGDYFANGGAVNQVVSITPKGTLRVRPLGVVDRETNKPKEHNTIHRYTKADMANQQYASGGVRRVTEALAKEMERAIFRSAAGQMTRSQYEAHMRQIMQDAAEQARANPTAWGRVVSRWPGG